MDALNEIPKVFSLLPKKASHNLYLSCRTFINGRSPFIGLDF
jgi:hypothetical protein